MIGILVAVGMIKDNYFVGGGTADLRPIPTVIGPRLTVFLAAVGLVLSLWLIIPDRYFLSQNADYEGYFEPAAKNLLHGYGFTWHGPSSSEGIPNVGFHLPPGSLFIRFPPAYLLMVTAAMATAEKFHLPAIYAVDALNVLAIGISAVCLFSIAAMVFGERRALLAPLLCVTYPGILLATKGGNAEIQLCAAVLGAVALLWRAVRYARRRMLGFFGAGLIFGCAMLVRTQGIVLLPACLIWLLVFPRQEQLRVRLGWVAVTLIASALAIAPWELWVYARSGALVPLATEGPASVYDGLTFAAKAAAPNAPPAAEFPDEVKRLSADFLVGCRNSPSVFRTFAYVGTQFRLRPKAVAEFFLIKAFRSWYATSSGQFDHESLILNLAYGLLFVWVLTVAVRRAGPPRLLATLVLSVVFSTWAVTIMVLSIVRYMIPAIAVMFVLTPAAIGFGRKKAPSVWVAPPTSEQPPSRDPERTDLAARRA